MSYYKLCAISGATGILRNHRRTARRRSELTSLSPMSQQVNRTSSSKLR
jgi:hypothetical protein